MKMDKRKRKPEKKQRAGNINTKNENLRMTEEVSLPTSFTNNKTAKEQMFHATDTFGCSDLDFIEENTVYSCPHMNRGQWCCLTPVWDLRTLTLPIFISTPHMSQAGKERKQGTGGGGREESRAKSKAERVGKEGWRQEMRKGGKLAGTCWQVEKE
ncbi:hypothetical protein Pcinc_011222 [Petrolisthes cinctipes]|uniref:Uncharacterized protein n=1 Tax=Petrolisthes cinctipes TaxID=88211 RepID=A0AAE1G1Q0_PETCI|nr:hypothetical protein Pcinc_011222 [Petrolisthes cinctipes]